MRHARSHRTAPAGSTKGPSESFDGRDCQTVIMMTVECHLRRSEVESVKIVMAQLSRPEAGPESDVDEEFELEMMRVAEEKGEKLAVSLSLALSLSHCHGSFRA